MPTAHTNSTATVTCFCGHTTVDAQLMTRAEVFAVCMLLDSDAHEFIECGGCDMFIDRENAKEWK